MHAKYEVCMCTSSKVMAKVKAIGYYSEGRSQFSLTENVQLINVHMHAKYEVCMCTSSKVMANVKVGHKPTNRQTDRQTHRQDNI